MLERRESAAFLRGEESPHKLKQRYTRTRSGCERCRAQHRKCDEGKPQCKRCADVNAECKYIAHVSFKNKNSQTLSNNLSPHPTGPSTSLNTYPTIEFIFDDGTGGIKPSSHTPDSHSNAQPHSQGHSIDILQSNSSLGIAQGWPLVGQSPLLSAEVELLKYYNHHIAPWLDVYDQLQTFGHHVTRLAMTSPCILELLLQLSAVFSSRPLELVTRRGAGLFHIQAMSNPPDAHSPSAALRSIACFVLARTLLFVDRIPDTWEPSFQGDGAFLYFRKFDFFDTTQRQIWFAFLTLILRLEIAYCLMNQRAPVWIPELAHQIQTHLETDDTGGDKFQRILNASVRCLKILVDVMNFSFLLPVTNKRTAASNMTDPFRIDKWKKLADELCAWHRSRPPDLEPLVDIENSEKTFPTVIFTSGAGISSNTLYHTAMHLLLINKPDLMSLEKRTGTTRIDAVQMSSHWHARRIFGIAINSEPEYTHCWDPATIAALSLMARQTRHSSQHHDIITYLDQLKAAGWHIDGLTNRLRSEWGPVDPVLK
ncbi:hypothetical protein F5Y12DRAFT_788889 [Xylaria sp. FL1777]|nr:hypothetical protein F5Y12DRAFT_788889 [Xylaria sp. FL1777]